MKKVAIIHYQPLEYYPPTTNFLQYLEGNLNANVYVFTSKNQLNRAPYISRKIKINRASFPKKKDSFIISLFKQALFNFSTFLRLLIFRPHVVLYYETYSAFPAYLYLKFFNKEAKLLIHFHEYFSKEWYEGGMKLVKLYHKIEVDFLFKKAYFISQTNEYRVEFFLADYPFLQKSKLRVLPNYPPFVWSELLNNKVCNFPDDNKELKLVYVGSLSLKATYIKEFCTWLASCKHNVTFDIYSFNLDQETSDYLCNLNMPQVRFFSSGIEYSDLPAILKDYDVGLILYRGLSNNSKYCASNKLFEYMACGLDVWFSDKMIGTYPYITENTFPKVIKIDFENILQFDVEKAIDREGLPEVNNTYFAEKVYYNIIQELN
ncbi:hypothetical protein ACMA1I_03650 [Pontibacter sp. 13R65]|uniref:hypothetical protein n=1 Tax=Pontibacter sp. 13R65 TaxID=3127458 RepID=UPI00301B945B